MASRKQSSARRRAILEHAAQVGDEQAAAEAGVTVATLRRWRGDPEPEPEPLPQHDEPADDAGDLDDDDPSLDAIERMRRSAERARVVAHKAIKRTDDLLTAGRASDARNAAAAGGIWADKAAKWDELIIDAEDRRERQQAQLAQEQAEQLVTRTRALLDALRVPVGHEHVRPVVAAALRGEQLTDEMVERARVALRDVYASEVREMVEREIRERVTPERIDERQLPEHAKPHPDDAQREQGFAPVRRVRTSRERRKRERAEVVRGEVVDEPRSWRPTGRGQRGVEQAVDRGQLRDILRIDHDGNPINPERGRAPWDE